MIDETILRRCGEGFQGLMAEQLQHLIACAERPNIKVHVIPADVALHAGLSAPFALARLRDGGWFGHLETQLGGSVVEHDDDIATLLARWEAVRSEALPAAVDRADQGSGGDMDLTGARWRKSSRSGSGECVEVADNLPEVIGVRDSKDQRGPALTFTPKAWATFLAHTKRS